MKFYNVDVKIDYGKQCGLLFTKDIGIYWLAQINSLYIWFSVSHTIPDPWPTYMIFQSSGGNR